MLVAEDHRRLASTPMILTTGFISPPVTNSKEYKPHSSDLGTLIL
ncbi:hypothetical protein Lser_V15G11648 [Lactuca serriola]